MPNYTEEQYKNMLALDLEKKGFCKKYNTGEEYHFIMTPPTTYGENARDDSDDEPPKEFRYSTVQCLEDGTIGSISTQTWDEIIDERPVDFQHCKKLNESSTIQLLSNRYTECHFDPRFKIVPKCGEDEHCLKTTTEEGKELMLQRIGESCNALEADLHAVDEYICRKALPDEDGY